VDSEFYKKARSWYNTIYVNPANERIVYFVIFVISFFCLYQAFGVMNMIKANKNKRNTYILLMEHKDPDSFIKVSQFAPNKDQVISLLEVILIKYVLNMETLKYSNDETGMDAITKKSLIIKNLSGKEVYDNYIANTYKDDGDMTLSILKLQKTAKIRGIRFIYEDTNFIEKIYSNILSTNIPNAAKVYFTTETTDEKQKKQNFVATINFNFYIDSDRKANSAIEFKVNDYYVEKDVNIGKKR